jgi:hypothetical protein
MGDEGVVWTQTDFEGRYANCFRVGHNAFELLIDFAQCGPESRIATLHTRIIVSPMYGRVLLALLADSLRDFDTNDKGTGDDNRVS